MNWKLIFQLSVFGLIMALATVSLIPYKIEPAFWIVIFVFCAYVIAKVCGRKYFLHGFLVSLVNCVWITSAHLYFYKSYIANHKEIAGQFSNALPGLSSHPRLCMAIMGTIVGVFSGLFLGLFAIIASKIVKKKGL
jgi:hypothetical protein